MAQAIGQNAAYRPAWEFYKMDILKTKIEQILNREISAQEFSNWYEDWFYSTSKKEQVDDKTFKLMEDLYSWVAYYVPDENVRKQDHSYIGEERLATEIKKLYDEIRALG